VAAADSTVELTMRGKVVAWLAALAAGAAWLGDDANARLAAAMLAAPLLVDFVCKQRRLHHTEVSVRARRTVAGAPFVEHLTLVHRGRRPLRECLIAEPRTMRSEPPALLPTLIPDEPASIALRARSPQRSHALERVFVAMSVWPLGLFRTRAVLPVEAELVTEPARVALSAEVVQAIPESEAGVRSLQAGAEFHSLREHQMHEDARGVHALRSATVGTLVRRVTDGRLPHAVGIVLDLRRPPGRPLHQGARRFEWSLGACASLVTCLRHRAARIHVLVIDSDPVHVVVRGTGQEVDLLTLLAEASPTPHAPLRRELFDDLRRLEHCFWIPAGAYRAAAEIGNLPSTVTIVGGDFE
jgi:hypothetical protein